MQGGQDVYGLMTDECDNQDSLIETFSARSMPEKLKARMRMDVSTFEYLCSMLAPSLQKQDTNMRSAIPVEVKVAVAISKLATGNSMQTIADLCKIGLSTSQLAVTQFVGAIKTNFLEEIYTVALHINHGEMC